MARRKAGELVTRTVAVAAIVRITGLTRGAVQQRIGRAVKAGDLHRAKVSPDRFEAGALGAWAAGKWPEYAEAIGEHWPRPMSIKGKSATIVLTVGRARIHQPPGTLAACHALIAEQIERIERLEQELAEARAEADRERTDAQRWRDFQHKSKPHGNW